MLEYIKTTSLVLNGVIYMKKFIAVVAGCAAAILTLTACSGNTNTFAATYFLQGDASVRDIGTVNETLTYKVYSFAGKDELNAYDTLLPSLPSGTGTLKFNVTDGSTYKTTIKTLADKSGYEFHSILTVNGEYTYGDGKTYKVEGDTTEITATFKGVNDKFHPIEVTKVIKNTFPTSGSPAEEKQFVTASCTYKITYGKNATVTVTPGDDEKSKTYYKNLADKDTVIKKYDKKDFVDNDLLFTVFRNFDYAANFSYSYSSIDALSGALVSANATVIGESGKSPVKLVKKPAGAQLNDAFNACGVKFATTGEYGKAYAYCYYALSVNGSGNVSEDKDKENGTRRVPLIIAQPLIHNTGYMIMALDTTNFGI